MTKVGNVINMIVLLVVLVLAGEWSFGLYGALAGLLLAIVGLAVVIKLQRSAEDDRRFDPTGGNRG
jgi:predicted PurR-regulated permease PerM